MRMIAAHDATAPCFSQRGLEIPVNLQVFVIVFDLPTALFNARAGPFTVVEIDRIFEPPATTLPQGEIANRHGARVKVLMKPVARWHQNAARFPVDSNPLARLLPEERVALPAEYCHMSAGSVAGRLLITSYRELRDVRCHRLRSQIKVHVKPA